VARFRVALTPRFRDNASGVEGRGQPVPDLQRVAAGGGERGGEPDAEDAGDRVGAAAVVREAHRGRRPRPSLRNASAKVNRVARSGSRDGGYGGSQRGYAGSGGRSSGGQGGGDGWDADPWATDGPGGDTDEPPF
jgi:single-strand DNA-binding protein